LFDRKLIQSVVCLIVHRGATIRDFSTIIEGVPPKFIARSLAIIPEQIHIKNSETHTRLNALRANTY
jgi:hypothetical protein